MTRDNLFYTDGLAKDEEYVEVIHRKENLYIEKIVSKGQKSPDGFIYDQETDEYVVLIQGRAVLDVEGNKVVLNSGESLFIPAHTKHRVESTSENPPCIWLCVHNIIKNSNI